MTLGIKETTNKMGWRVDQTSLLSSAPGHTASNLAALRWHNAALCLGAMTCGQLSDDRMMVRRKSSPWRGRGGTGRAVGRRLGKSAETARGYCCHPELAAGLGSLQLFPHNFCKLLRCQRSARPEGRGL